MLAILNIGPLEVLLLVGAAILLFGGDLPEVTRKVGKMLARLRGVASDLTDHVYRERPLPDHWEREPPPRIDGDASSVETGDIVDVEASDPNEEPHGDDPDSPQDANRHP